MATRGMDVKGILNLIQNFIKSRANQICAAPCDGFVLKMHYRWSFYVLLAGFCSSWYQWYHRDVISCVIHFNSNEPVRLEYINICLSYPYINDGKNGRRYLLFYRWIYWSLLGMAAIYYIPRKVSKNLENAKAKKLLEDIAANKCRYDHQAEKELTQRVVHFFTFNLRTHNSLYVNYIMVNFLAFLIDIIALLYFDFLLQGRFISLGLSAYPYQRDVRNFSDPISQTFPPFAKCTLNENNELVNKRTEELGCHLTFMELYEKLFLGLWFWLIFLMIATLCYIIFLFLMFLPKFRTHLLRISKPLHATERVRQVIERVSYTCKIGDIYFLYRLKSHMSHARFYEVLVRLSDPSLSQIIVDRQIQKGNPTLPNNHMGMQHPNAPQFVPQNNPNGQYPQNYANSQYPQNYPNGSYPQNHPNGLPQNHPQHIYPNLPHSQSQGIPEKENLRNRKPHPEHQKLLEGKVPHKNDNQSPPEGVNLEMIKKAIEEHK